MKKGSDMLIKKTEYMDHNFEGDFHIEKIKSKIPWDMPKMHSHNYHELYFLLSGSRRYFVGHTIYDVSPGDIVIIPQNTLHRTSGKNAGYERFALYFSDEFISDFRKEINERAYYDLLNMGCVYLGEAVKEKIKCILLEIEQEKIKNDIFSNSLIKKYLFEIFVLVIRCGSKKSEEVDAKTERIESVLCYINENFANNITLSALAKRAFMEETYFSKRFKAITGFCFSEYLNQVRINMAKELLINSDLSISQIAEHCGFSGANYFGDVFKKRTNFSPLSYRKFKRK